VEKTETVSMLTKLKTNFSNYALSGEKFVGKLYIFRQKLNSRKKDQK